MREGLNERRVSSKQVAEVNNLLAVASALEPGHRHRSFEFVRAAADFTWRNRRACADGNPRHQGIAAGAGTPVCAGGQAVSIWREPIRDDFSSPRTW